MFRLFIECFTKKYFQFSGRAGRKEYISFGIIAFIIRVSLSAVILLLKYIEPSSLITIIFILLNIAFVFLYIIPYISLSVRRFHDINLSGLWYMAFAIFLILLKIFYGSPSYLLAEFALDIVLMLIKGTNGPNKYGEQPQ